MTRQRPIDGKPLTLRRAVAVGSLRLGAASRNAIRSGRVEKGDPVAVGEIAGIAAMKRTPELLPHCHVVPLTGSSVDLRLTRSGVSAVATSETVYRTGVEMEALVGVTVALLTVWDMVKYLEKDANGQYPATRLGPVSVRRKTKEPLRSGP